MYKSPMVATSELICSNCKSRAHAWRARYTKTTHGLIHGWQLAKETSNDTIRKQGLQSKQDVKREGRSLSRFRDSHCRSVPLLKE